MPKSYQLKRKRELSIINEYLTKAGGEPMTEQDVESVLNHYNPTYFYESYKDIYTYRRLSIFGVTEVNALGLSFIPMLSVLVGFMLLRKEKQYFFYLQH